jgi:predicted RNA binding protein YcfA (HicA-like mRNA interferase family)
MTKRRVLIRELEAAGFKECQGTKHGKYRKGSVTVMVPRHAEIKDRMADVIRRQAGLK